MILDADDIAARFGAKAADAVADIARGEPGATALKLFNTYDGVETRIVGGALRNALSGRDIGDLDCATTAVPQQVLEMARAAGLKAIETGIDHGTVTVIIAGHPVEITTLRADVETDGRHAKVAFGTDWLADAQRRDFTVNAFYLDAQGRVHDPVGGADDLKRRIIRFIGDPDMRIAEDYLRILRFFRFVAAFDAVPDMAALDAVERGRGGLDQLSAERIGKEMLTLLGARDPGNALHLMQMHGVLAAVLGAAPNVPRLRRLVMLEDKLGDGCDALLRLAALAVLTPADAFRLGTRLRLSNAQADRIAGAIDQWWQVTPQAGERALKIAIYRLGNETFNDRVHMAWLMQDASAEDAQWLATLRLADWWHAPEFPVGGRDLLDAGLPAGSQVGAMLRRLEQVWIDSDFTATRKMLLETAEPWINGS